MQTRGPMGLEGENDVFPGVPDFVETRAGRAAAKAGAVVWPAGPGEAHRGRAVSPGSEG